MTGLKGAFSEYSDYYYFFNTSVPADYQLHPGLKNGTPYRFLTTLLILTGVEIVSSKSSENRFIQVRRRVGSGVRRMTFIHQFLVKGISF